MFPAVIELELIIRDIIVQCYQYSLFRQGVHKHFFPILRSFTRCTYQFSVTIGSKFIISSLVCSIGGIPAYLIVGTVEQWTCIEEQQASLQSHSRTLSHTTVIYRRISPNRWQQRSRIIQILADKRHAIIRRTTFNIQSRFFYCTVSNCRILRALYNRITSISSHQTIIQPCTPEVNLSFKEISFLFRQCSFVNIVEK